MRRVPRVRRHEVAVVLTRAQAELVVDALAGASTLCLTERQAAARERALAAIEDALEPWATRRPAAG